MSAREPDHYVGEYKADYTELTSEQLVASDPAVDDLLRNSRPVSVNGWLSIETAPKDGEQVLLWGGMFHFEEDWGGEYPLKRPALGYWYTTRWVIGQGDGHDNYCVLTGPTHWMPLPAPPTEAA